MRYQNNTLLREYLNRGAAGSHREHMRQASFELDDATFASTLGEVCAQHPHLTDDEVRARAAFRMLTHSSTQDAASPAPSFLSATIRPPIARRWIIAWAIAVLVLLFSIALRAEPDPPAGNAARDAVLAQLGSGAVRVQFLSGGNWSYVASGTPFPVTCVSGCSSTGAFGDNSAFTVGTTAITPIGAYYTTGSAPSISSGNAGRVRMDSNSYLYVDCITGCSASAGFGDNSAFTAGTTAIGITGGWYSTSPTNCTSGNACAPQLTNDRKLFVQAFQGTSPWVDNINQWDGTSLGVPTAYGTAPTTGNYIGVNAYVTNVPAVSQSGSWSFTCSSGCGGSGGTSLADEATFAPGTTSFTPSGCFFQTTATNNELTNLQAGAPQCTTDRKLFVQAFQGTSPWVVSASGNFGVTQQTSPWVDSITTWGGGTLGAMGNYGTSPGAVLVPGVNAFITNTPAVTQSGTWNNRVQDGSGNGITSNSATTTSKFGLDGNILSILGTAPTTAGKSDVKGADGDVFVRQTTAANLNVREDTSGATGSAPPSRADFIGGIGSGATGGEEIGIPVADTYKAINISTATTTLIVTGVSGRQVRISAIHLIAGGADNVALIEGTGATCGTGSAGMAGGTTAASGYNFAANGGLTMGSGVGTVISTATTGDSVCIVTSAAVQLSGGVSYTIF